MSDDHKQSDGDAPTRASDATPGDTDEFRGRIVGSYELVEILAKGGMGTVYLARHPKLPRKAVIKFLRNPDNKLHKELFEREAQVLASLGDHDKIVTIYEWGEDGDHGFFVMEFVDASLSDLIKKSESGLAVQDSIRLIADAAEALGYAHKQGILHRDVKPANLMYDTRHKRVKVTDFGVAKFMAPEGSKGATIVGTPMYMAPEQLDASYIGPESDIYGLGITLAEILVGKVPPTETRGAVAEPGEERPLIAYIREKRPDVDEALLAIIDKATAVKREKRYDSMEKMAAELRALLDETPASVSSPTSNSEALPATVLSEPPHDLESRRSFVMAGGALALLLVVAGIFAGPWLSQGGGTAQADALRRAKTRFDSGNLDGARELYQTLIDTHGAFDQALYGLGYTLMDDPAAAKAAFGDITDDATRYEGLAAVSYAEGKYDEATLNLSRTDTPYAAVVRAKIDESEEAIPDTQLASSVYFEWQRQEALRTIGQAYYRLGRLDEAEKLFAQLSDTPGGAELAKLYLERIANRRSYTERYQNIAAVREAIESRKIQDQESADDDWTSEALSYLIVPVSEPIGPVARELGILDWLPTLLARALEEKSALQPVNRDEIDRVLQEYMLMGALGDPAEQRNLGKLRGARMLIKFENMKLSSDLEWLIDLVDTRTTEEYQAGGVPYSAEFSRDAFVESVASNIIEEVSDRYPLRGRVYRDGDQVILNIGEPTGVRTGMRFDLRESPAKRDVIENARVEVLDDDAIDTDETVVSYAGIDLSDIPDDPEKALYAEIVTQ